MAQTFLPLPNGSPGSSVAVPASSDAKTFYAGGTFVAEQVILETSSDNVHFNIAGSITLDRYQPLLLDFTAAFARVRIVGLRSGTPVCFLGVNTTAGSITSANIVPPAGPGYGPAVAVSTLPLTKTFYVVTEGASQNVNADVEVSLDGGVTFNPLFKILGSLFRNGDAVVIKGFYGFARIRVLAGSTVGFYVTVTAED